MIDCKNSKFSIQTFIFIIFYLKKHIIFYFYRLKKIKILLNNIKFYYLISINKNIKLKS